MATHARVHTCGFTLRGQYTKTKLQQKEAWLEYCLHTHSHTVSSSTVLPLAHAHPHTQGASNVRRWRSEGLYAMKVLFQKQAWNKLTGSFKMPVYKSLRSGCLDGPKGVFRTQQQKGKSRMAAHNRAPFRGRPWFRYCTGKEDENLLHGDLPRGRG